VEAIVREAIAAFHKDSIALMRQHIEELGRVLAADFSEQVRKTIEVEVQKAIDTAVRDRVLPSVEHLLTQTISRQMAALPPSPSTPPTAAVPQAPVLPTEPPPERPDNLRNRIVPHLRSWQGIAAAVIVLACVVIWLLRTWNSPPSPTPQTARQPVLGEQPPESAILKLLAQVDKSTEDWPRERSCRAIQDQVVNVQGAIQGVLAKRKAVKDAIARYIDHAYPTPEDRVLLIALWQVRLQLGFAPDGGMEWTDPNAPKGQTATALARYLNETYLPQQGIGADGAITPLQRLMSGKPPDSFPDMIDGLMRHILLSDCKQ
jgi:hypothetical protein